RAAGDPVCLSGAANWPALDAPGVAQAAQRLGGAKSVALVDPGTGEFYQGGRCDTRGRDRLESRFPALRLSGGGLLRAATVVPASALRTAGPRRPGPEARHATEHGAQDHARSASLRRDLASRFETGTGGCVLFVHVADGHGCASDRHRLSTQRVRGFRPVDLSAWGVATRITFFRT